MTVRSFRAKRMRRRFQTAMAVLGILTSLTFVGSTALAVHDADLFELDGNPSSNHSGVDWATLYNRGNLGGQADGLEAFTWVADSSGGTPADGSDLGYSIFTGGGSKDPQPISAWAWKNGGGLPDKDNLLHVFAARFRVPSDQNCRGVGGESDGSTDCVVLYFGSDRHDSGRGRDRSELPE